ncbi:MAG: F0F1 ATP synthase subunit delta [Bifidobacteriaceae bacterium]|jgi:F-type H+-transporting ATPase subunit delta|nr:F0F1 ATP synthase subunit delta [Bifidobacteriaceae bacterium]
MTDKNKAIRTSSIRTMPAIVSAKELFIIASAVCDNATLGNFLSDFAHTTEEKQKLANEVFDKTCDMTKSVLYDLLVRPYSSAKDLEDSIEDTALDLIFDTAALLGILDEIVYELNLAAYAIKEYPLLSEKLGEKGVDKEIRKSIIDEFFLDKVNPLTLMLMHHSTYALRERNFVSTLFWLVSLITKKLNRVLVNVTAAVQPTQTQLERLEHIIENREKKEATFNIIIDGNVISGIKVQYGDTVIDGTVSSKIRQLKESVERV